MFSPAAARSKALELFAPFSIAITPADGSLTRDRMPSPPLVRVVTDDP